MTTQSTVLKDATPINTITLENANGVFSVKRGETVTSTVTFPAATGTVALNPPFFRAQRTTSQAATSGVSLEAIFPTELYDNINCYNPSTGRFTPTVAGFYQINASVTVADDTAITAAILYLSVNGSVNSGGVKMSTNVLVDPAPLSISNIVYLNGSTDYVSAWVNITGTTPYMLGDINYPCVFSGFLVNRA